MKRTLLSIAAMGLILGSSADAQESGLYIGLGYADTNIDISLDNIDSSLEDLLDLSTDSIVLLAGYDINEYFGIEGRYYLNASEAAYEYYIGNTPLSGKYKAESFALYAKPQYRFAMLNIYALLGVASNDYTFDSLESLFGSSGRETLFSWGAGVKTNVTGSLGIFVDYTNFGENSGILINTDLSSWNIGFSYKF